MAKFRISSVQSKSSDSGEWFNLLTGQRLGRTPPPTSDDPLVLVARADHPDLKAKTARLTAEFVRHERQKQKGIHAIRRSDPTEALTPAVQLSLAMRAWAGTILRDWVNIYDDDDAPIPFTVEKAEEFMSDPGMGSFSDCIAQFAETLRLDSVSTSLTPEDVASAEEAAGN